MKSEHAWLSIVNIAIQDDDESNGQESCPPVDDEHDGHTEHGAQQTQPHRVIAK